MQALSQLDTTRVIIAEQSENTAFELDSALRDAGIATKLEVSDDLTQIAELLASGNTDIALVNNRLAGLDTWLPKMREQYPHTPMILLTDDDPAEAVVSALNMGATDAVPSSAPERLALVVKRELEHVSERRNFSQLRRALKEAEQRCQLLLQGSTNAIAYVHEGMHIHANNTYLEMFGFSDVADIEGSSLVDVLSQDNTDELKTCLKALRNGESQEASLDVELVVQNTTRQACMSLTHAQYEGEDCLQVTVTYAQADESPDNHTNQIPTTPAAEQLELPGFLKAADSFFTTGNGYSFLLVAEIDQIAQLQNAYGLAGTETICRRVWHKLWEELEDYPLVRLSNNQFAFAVVAENHAALTELAKQTAASINDFIFELQDKTVRPTMTISGALVDSRGTVACLDEAFANLREIVEQNSANTVDIPNALAASAANVVDDAKIIMRQITEAIEKKKFVLLFQPIISLRGDSDEHYEVFLRMVDDEGQQLEPARFLQTAVDHDVAGKIDRWVILQSIKMLSAHRAKGHNTRLTINLTSNSIRDSEFNQWLSVAIKAARLPSDAVIFQIAEADANMYLRQTREFIEGLRNMHCRASLSHFGNLDDPFETLRHVSVDMVKLEGSTVIKMDEDDGLRSRIIEQIKQLQNHGKLTIVPMVESANTLSTLWQAGANYIQGHYLQEPSTEMNYDFETEE